MLVVSRAFIQTACHDRNHRRSLLNGRDLAAERVRHGLRAVDVAAPLGVSRSRVAGLEREWRVSTQMARRYLDALDALQQRQRLAETAPEGVQPATIAPSPTSRTPAQVAPPGQEREGSPQR